MRTLLLHLVLLVPALFVGAVEYEGYTNPAGTKFPIAIYDNVPISIKRVQILSDAEQKAYFDSIRLAGFNVELWGKEDIWRKEPINKWTPYLKSLGMNTIISTPGIFADTKRDSVRSQHPRFHPSGGQLGRSKNRNQQLQPGSKRMGLLGNR